MSRLDGIAYGKTFMLFVGGLILTHKFGWEVGLSYYFFGVAVRPLIFNNRKG